MRKFDARVRTAWLLLLASVILWVPVLITMPLALFWRSQSQGTVYASHFRAIIRYCWVVILLPLPLIALPSVTIAIVVGLVIMFVFAYAALDGMRSASYGNRYKGMFA